MKRLLARALFWLIVERILDRVPVFAFEHWRFAFHRSEDLLSRIHRRTGMGCTCWTEAEHMKIGAQ